MNVDMEYYPEPPIQATSRSEKKVEEALPPSSLWNKVFAPTKTTTTMTGEATMKKKSSENDDHDLIHTDPTEEEPDSDSESYLARDDGSPVKSSLFHDGSASNDESSSSIEEEKPKKRTSFLAMFFDSSVPEESSNLDDAAQSKDAEIGLTNDNKTDEDNDNSKEDANNSSDGKITGEESAPQIGPFQFCWKKDTTAANKGSEEEIASVTSHMDDTGSRQDRSENSSDMFEKADTPVMQDSNDNGGFFGKLLAAKNMSLQKEDPSLFEENKARTTDNSIDDAAEADKSNDSVDDEKSGSNKANGSWGFFSKLRGVKQELQLDPKANNTENQKTQDNGEVESREVCSNDEVVTDEMPEKVESKKWPISKILGGRNDEKVCDVDPLVGNSEDETLKMDDLTDGQEAKQDAVETNAKESLPVDTVENSKRYSTESRKRASFISMFLDPSASANQAYDATKNYDQGDDLMLEEGIGSDQEEQGEELLLEEGINDDQGKEMVLEEEEKSVDQSQSTASAQDHGKKELFHNAVEFMHETELELEMELSEGGLATPSSLLTDGPYWDDNEKPKKEEMCCSLFCRH